MLPFLTLDQADMAQKTVFVRADLNLPCHDNTFLDLTRAERLFPTLDFLVQKQARIIIASHRGRPKGKIDATLSMHPVYCLLKELWMPNIQWSDNCIGHSVEQIASMLPPGNALVLENLRFHEGEEKNDPHFSQSLASLADCYVNDAFACSHRAHASIVGITEYLPSFAGFELRNEFNALHQALEHPQRPLMVIIGGSKISTKLSLLTNVVKKADVLILGGGLANTFLGAQGYPIGQSLVETELYPQALEILAIAATRNCKIVLPEDVLVTERLEVHRPFKICNPSEVTSYDFIADIGPKTVKRIEAYLKASKTVIWNGPLGVFEIPPFHQGSVDVAKKISAATQRGLFSVIGGGDTLAVTQNIKNCTFSYLSTAGGAFLEWLAGFDLPGLEALMHAKQRQHHVTSQ